MVRGQTDQHGRGTAKLGYIEVELWGLGIFGPFHRMYDYFKKYFTDDRVYLVCFEENEGIIINVVVEDVGVFGTILVHGGNGDFGWIADVVPWWRWVRWLWISSMPLLMCRRVQIFMMTVILNFINIMFMLGRNMFNWISGYTRYKIIFHLLKLINGSFFSLIVSTRPSPLCSPTSIFSQ